MAAGTGYGGINMEADIPSSVNPWFTRMRPPPLVFTGTSVAAATGVESDVSGDDGMVSRGFLRISGED